LVDLARAGGMQSILHNPIHTLKTATTEYHDEAQSVWPRREPWPWTGCSLSRLTKPQSENRPAAR